MAKGNKATSEGAKATKKHTKALSKDELVNLGARGIIKRFAGAARGIAAKNNFSGVKAWGTQDGSEIKDVKGRTAAALMITRKFNPDGVLFDAKKVDENGATFTELKKLAKAAAKDLEAKNYSGNVKAFIEFIIGASGNRTSDTSGLGALADLL
jgi:hypothetical protein